MNAKFNKDGNLEINTIDLIENLSDDHLTSFLDTFSTDSRVIRNVVDQILTGWTEMDSHGSSGMAQSDSNGASALDKACREVAKRSGETSAREIKRLEAALLFQENQAKEYRDKYWDLYHKKDDLKDFRWIGEENRH